MMKGQWGSALQSTNNPNPNQSNLVRSTTHDGLRHMQSWQEYTRSKQKKTSQIYNDNKVKSDFKKKKYTLQKHEKETDALLSGQANKKKQRHKHKNKKKKTLLRTQTYYQTAQNIGDETIDGSAEEVDYDSYYDFPVHLSASKRKRLRDKLSEADPLNPNSTIGYYKREKIKKYNKTHAKYEATPNIVYQNIEMLLTKRMRMVLINGYIKYKIYQKHTRRKSKHVSFRFQDIVRLIQLYYNTNIFIWCLNKRFLSKMQNANTRSTRYERRIGYTAPTETAPPKKRWKLSFNLQVFALSKGNYKAHIRRAGRGVPYTHYGHEQKKNEVFIDLELQINKNNSTLPSFIKIYYELYCDAIDKISLWKGTQKYRPVNNKFTYHDNLLIPRGYIKRSELLGNDNVNIKLAVRFLCIEWLGYDDWFVDIRMTQNVKFNWHISNNYSILDKFKSKTESILFSKNFEHDNWCVYCKNIQTPTNKKKKKKFFIGLMLIHLPWYFNYVKIQLIVKIKSDNEDHKKEVIKNIWSGFESSIQIPFKYNILQHAKSLHICVKFKILKVFDSNDKRVTKESTLNKFFRFKTNKQTEIASQTAIKNVISSTDKNKKNIRLSGKEKRILAIKRYIKYHIYGNKRDISYDGSIIALIELYCKATKTGQTMEVFISHIESVTTFYFHDPNSIALRKMNTEMKRLTTSAPKPTKYLRVARGIGRIAAQYYGYYARAKVISEYVPLGTEKQWVVEFIDYGHKMVVSHENCVILPGHLRSDKIPPLQKHKCKLAGITANRQNENVYNKAELFLSKYLFQKNKNKKLRIKILYDDQYNKIWHVELFKGNKSINKLLAGNGFVTLDKKLAVAFRRQTDYDGKWDKEHMTYVKKYFDSIAANIQLAIKAEKNIWCRTNQ